MHGHDNPRRGLSMPEYATGESGKNVVEELDKFLSTRGG